MERPADLEAAADVGDGGPPHFLSLSPELRPLHNGRGRCSEPGAKGWSQTSQDRTKEGSLRAAVCISWNCVMVKQGNNFRGTVNKRFV